jgi:flagellar M-ring protein FliF
MDFLSRAYPQLAELYRSMAPGSRLMASLLAGVVLLGMGYLFVHQGSLPDVDLMHGVPLSASQLPVMEAAFDKASLKGYAVRGTSIFVPRGQESAYMAALAAAKALPPNFGDALREAVNSSTVFDLGPQRDQRMRIAKQEELAQGIRKMTGIENAYVLYDVDSKPGAFKEKVITATVMVKPASAGQLDASLVSAIREMVACSIAGLKPENIAVTDLSTRRTWHGNPEDGAGADDNLYNSLKRTYEQDLKAKILGALCFIPNVTVAVSVALDHERFTRIKQDTRSAAPDRRGGNAANSRPKDGRSGRLATSSLPPNTATILQSLLGGSRGDDDAAEAEKADPVSHEQVEKESVGLTPTVARVSVGVPISYFKKVWQERNPVEPGGLQKMPDQAALDQIRVDESAKIQRHVAQLLPSAEGVAKAAELVTVTTFQDIPVLEPPAPEFSQQLLSWARESWRTLGTIGLLLIGMLLLRSMARAAPAAPEAPAAAAASAEPVDEPAADQSAVIPPPHARRFHNAGPSARDELSELVEDDPDAAANILRNWIGQVDHVPAEK